MLSFVLSPEERTIDCLSKIAQGKYTAVTSPSFAFVWCFKRTQCSEQLGTGHVWHGSESRICDLVCATPMHRQLKKAAHCTRIYCIYIRHHKTHTHTRTGGPGPECVELIWAYAPVQFTPHSFVSPSFIGRVFRIQRYGYITVYHGYRRCLTTELSKIELPSYLSFASVDFAINRCRKHDPQGRACKPHSASSGPLLDAMDIWCFSICSNSSSISNMQFVVWCTWRNRNWSSWLYNP